MRIGTRASALALAQARWVAERLGDGAELVPITTSGDRGKDGDKGRFTKEIEEALLAGEIDLAVHSAKDVPAKLPDGLSIAGVPERADPRDALCGARALDALPEGAVVGTSSLRRRAQVLALRPDLEVRELRGNVDTRLRRLAEARYDGLVLAAAGLWRLGRENEGTPLAADQIVPAAGQGCLVLEARTGDEPVVAVAAGITDDGALTCLTAERALVAALGATCNTPVGAYAERANGRLTLSAFAGSPDGSAWVRDRLGGDVADPRGLGEEVASRLLAAGAAAILGASPGGW